MMKKFKITVWIVGMIILLLLIGSGLYYSNTHILFPIEQVSIRGDFHRVSQQDLQTRVQPFVKEGFFGIDLTALQSNLQQIPGVAVAEVRRVWPDKIDIVLFDQDIVAYWNDNAILNVYGESFAMSDIVHLESLPQFYGPTDQAVTILDHYQKMSRLLTPLKLKITMFTLMSNGDWSLVVNNQMTIQLGSKNTIQTLKRFVEAYPRVFAKKNHLAHSVDLRYAHGMAVDW